MREKEKSKVLKTGPVIEPLMLLVHLSNRSVSERDERSRDGRRRRTSSDGQNEKVQVRTSKTNEQGQRLRQMNSYGRHDDGSSQRRRVGDDTEREGGSWWLERRRWRLG
ncbi:hypothetical protein PIB30_043097 [Stylosanthes scabra]|uniref:Uncharacterized protein n=1 Tax=Stylosanthes scabra TaxID=79078 RepID=A0ABU6UE71_9FABA|nr:hypothetical protein [Stylosanthes scabra]